MHVRSHAPPPSALRWFWVIAGVSVTARVAAAIYLGNHVTPQPGTADQVSYHTLALRVAEGHGFSFATGWWPATQAGQPTAHWSYPYVLYLAGVYTLFGPNPLVARILQALVVGVLQPWLTLRVARRLFGPRVGLAAAALAAAYGYFVYYAGALMTESFFIVALLWSADVALRLGAPADANPRPAPLAAWAALGLALAATLLLRQAFLVCVPVLLAWIVWRLRRRGGPDGGTARLGASALVRRLALTALVAGACVLPWTARNYLAFHEFVLLNTNAGFAFFWGNHPVHGHRFVPILPGDGSLYGALIPDDLRALNEAEMDRALLRRGLGFVAQDPVRYARLSASRAVEYFKFWPSSRSDRLSNLTRVLSFGVCLPFMVAGVLLAVTGRGLPSGRGDGPALAAVWLVLGVACVYSLAHLLTWTLVRYRLPVDGLLLPFAALAAIRLRDAAGARARAVRAGALAASS